MVLKIAIIGGGVNGFSCAVRIIEYYGSSASVTLISEEFTPKTTGKTLENTSQAMKQKSTNGFATGDGSAGLWGPYLCGSTSPEKIKQWSKDTHDFFRSLWTTVDAVEAGVCLLPVVRVTTLPEGLESFWKDIVFGFEEFSNLELKKLQSEHSKTYTSGVRFVSFTLESTKFLPYLMKRFKKAGGNIIQEKVQSLYTFLNSSEYDVVVNCTGLGAKSIVPDSEMHSIRGQVIRVKADWVFSTFLDESDDGRYIIPNYESVVLGGTHQVNDYNITPSENDRMFILNGCKTILPGLSSAVYLKDWVGLRPGRTSVRLEKELCDNGKILIHNYGHGGSGVTLAWGCALDVLNLVKETKSKL